MATTPTPAQQDTISRIAESTTAMVPANRDSYVVYRDPALGRILGVNLAENGYPVAIKVLDHKNADRIAYEADEREMRRTF